MLTLTTALTHYRLLLEQVKRTISTNVFLLAASTGLGTAVRLTALEIQARLSWKITPLSPHQLTATVLRQFLTQAIALYTHHFTLMPREEWSKSKIGRASCR